MAKVNENDPLKEFVGKKVKLTFLGRENYIGKLERVEGDTLSFFTKGVRYKLVAKDRGTIYFYYPSNHFTVEEVA